MQFKIAAQKAYPRSFPKNYTQSIFKTTSAWGSVYPYKLTTKQKTVKHINIFKRKLIMDCLLASWAKPQTPPPWGALQLQWFRSPCFPGSC